MFVQEISIASVLNLIVKFQSAYRKHHSPETPLLKVHDVIMRALDNHEEVILVLLDLTASFDTIDHEILIERLEHRYGVRSNA